MPKQKMEVPSADALAVILAAVNADSAVFNAYLMLSARAVAP